MKRKLNVTRGPRLSAHMVYTVIQTEHIKEQQLVSRDICTEPSCIGRSSTEVQVHVAKIFNLLQHCARPLD